ncbi:MAG: RES domain-containing protein [Candidatus Velamenicoccus archaeovorus]
MTVRFRHVRRAGPYLRVADPDWVDPLDGSYAAALGGRWNPPGSFPVVYLCATVEVAQAYALRKLEGLPYGLLDLRPHRRPELVTTEVPASRPVDVVTEEGCRAAGLPSTYPRDGRGRPVPWSRCRPVGSAAWEQGEPGIACRTAVPVERGEELAWFPDHGGPLPLLGRRAFEDWFA